MLAVNGYHAYNYYECGSMYIHRPDPSLSTAENLLKMLRPDQKYTDLEAHVLDIALLLHIEHGGGNNSTFTTRVVTSSGSDTYSSSSGSATWARMSSIIFMTLIFAPPCLGPFRLESAAAMTE